MLSKQNPVILKHTAHVCQIIVVSFSAHIWATKAMNIIIRWSTWLLTDAQFKKATALSVPSPCTHSAELLMESAGSRRYVLNGSHFFPQEIWTIQARAGEKVGRGGGERKVGDRGEPSVCGRDAARIERRGETAERWESWSPQIVMTVSTALGCTVTCLRQNLVCTIFTRFGKFWRDELSFSRSGKCGENGIFDSESLGISW